MTDTYISEMSRLQWDLLSGTAPSDEAGPSRNRALATSVVETEFRSVLLSDEARSILSNTAGLFDGLSSSANSSAKPEGTTGTPDAETTLIVAIALLHSFVQTNWTGPDLDFSPIDILPPSHGTAVDDLNAAALPFLTLQGEPAYHLSQHVSLFLLALRLLASLDDESIPTLSWWKLRLHLVHQALLDEPVSIDPVVLENLKALREHEVLKQDQDLLASLDLEIGLYYHSLGMDKPANQEFLSAAKAGGLEFELSGALGRKTKFQKDAQSQLILLAESRRRAGDEVIEKNGESSTSGEEKENDTLPTALLLNDDTLLEDTEFTKVTSSDPASTSRLAHLDPTDQPPLHPLDQSLLLSFCLSQHNHSPSSGLTANQMMPFISRVVAHPRNWSVHTTALLLRSRLESTRSRTVERSALQLQALIEQMPTSDSTPKERLKYFHQLPLPSKWEMEKELATRFLSLGVTRSALEIFSRLEMWEDAVGCLQRLEKEEEAERIVRDLLEGRKIESDLVHVMKRNNLSEGRLQKLTSAREAKLWCLLGDLALESFNATKDPEDAKKVAIGHYEKAWEVSGHTSSRAMRSMGSLKFGLGDWEASLPCLRHAVEINPLYSRVWFTMGVSYVKLEKWSDARDAFRRLVNVDEEDAEGWNNLAAVYLRMGEEGLSKDDPLPPVPFENKLLAFRALRQGLRHAHHNWRMWQNYMIISIDVGELSESARAMTRVIEEMPSTANHMLAIDVDVLDKLVDSVTREDWNGGVPKITTSNEGFGLLPIVDRLFDTVILPRVSDSPRIWRVHARLLRWKEDWSGAMEDYLRAYRCGLAQDPGIERDAVKWRDAVEEIDELVTVLSALGPKVVRGEGEKKGDWRFQARGIVRTFMGRTRQSFEGEPDWERLTDMLAGLKQAE